MAYKIKTDEWAIRIGQKVKKLRLERGLSLEQLAQLSGRKLQYIKRVEMGGRFSTFDDYVAIADVFDMYAGDLFVV